MAHIIGRTGWGHGGAVIALGASLVMASGCADSGDDGGAAPAKSESFTFDQVKALAEQRMGGDPACGFGEWSDSTWAIGDPYKSQVTLYREYGCAEREGALPNAAAQATYAEFQDATQAKAYSDAAKDDTSTVAVLLAANRVTTVRIGYLALNKLDFIKQVQSGCGGCGTLITTPRASDPTPGHVDKS